MIRTQVQLTEDQADSLHRLASERGVSLAALVREGVDHVLAERERAELWARAREVLGKYHSGLGDVGREHDKYLDEAYGEWKRS